MKEEQPLTQREIGRFEQVLKDITHRARNDRQIMILLEDEIEQLRRDFEKMKTKVYTAVAIYGSWQGTQSIRKAEEGE